jgi:hypothetical protein
MTFDYFLLGYVLFSSMKLTFCGQLYVIGPTLALDRLLGGLKPKIGSHVQRCSSLLESPNVDRIKCVLIVSNLDSLENYFDNLGVLITI